MSLVNKVVCPVCHSHNTGAAEIRGSDHQPEDGDLSICAYCGSLAVFVVAGETLKVRPITEQENEEAMENPDVKRALEFYRSRPARGV